MILPRIRAAVVLTCLCGIAHTLSAQAVALGPAGKETGQEVYRKTATFNQPQPGDVYKEYCRLTAPSGNDWRVTDPNIDLDQWPSAAYLLPNPILDLSIDDLQSAIKAEAVLTIWSGNIGTTGKKIRFNGNTWIDIPELAVDNGIPSGSYGYNYSSQYHVTVPLPLNNLLEGNNSVEGTCGNQVAPYGFGYGQFGLYMVLVRVYYNPATKSHPTGSIVSPVSGSVISENPAVTAVASGSSGINRVDFLAHYDGYDTDGDGVFLEYHHDYHSSPANGSLSIANHVGSSLGAPYQVTWNTQWIPDQTTASVRLIARIRGNDGVWYVTPEVSSLSLQRSGVSVKLSKPFDLTENAMSQGGLPVGANVYLPVSWNLSNLIGVVLMARTWNGDDQAAPSGTWLRVNDWFAPPYGASNYYSFDMLNLPATNLVNGTNSIQLASSSTTTHGTDLLWPGPALALRFISPAPIAPTALTPTIVGSTGFIATWTAVEGASGYELEVARDVNFTLDVSSFGGIGGGTTTSWPVSGLSPTTQYYYRVRATSASGTSENSNTIPVLTSAYEFDSISRSDDFNDPPLDLSLWTVVNPKGDATFSVSLDQFSVAVPGGISHDLWTDGNNVPRIMQPISNKDFQITTKFNSGVPSSASTYFLEGILVEADPNNLLRVEFHNDGANTVVHAAGFYGGLSSPVAYLNSPVAAAGVAPLYMQVTRTGDRWTIQYSTNGTTWTSAGSFNHIMAVSKVGAFGGNSGGSPSAFAVQVDWLRATLPAKPLLHTPADGATNISLSPALAWDPTTGAIKYHLQVANDQTFTSVAYSDTAVGATSRTATGLGGSAKYYWRVTGKGPYGSGSSSRVFNFTTASAISGIPVLVSPPNGSTGNPVSGLSFTWRRVNGATSYRMQLALDSLSTYLIDDPTITDTVRVITGLTVNQKYYWRVAANGPGGQAEWSATWTFDTAPLRPTVTTGAASGISQEGAVLNGTVNPKGLATTWWFEYGTTTGYGLVTPSQDAGSGSAPIAVNATVGGLTPGSQYHWRLVANCNTGRTEGLDAAFITVPPDPVAGAATDVGTTSLTANWEKATGAQSYRFDLATDAGFTSMVSGYVDKDVGDTTHYRITGLNPGTTYHYRVRARNGGGTSSNSNPISVVTSTSQLPAPVLISPRNGQTGLPTVGLTMSWTRVAESTGYHFQLGLDSSFLSAFVKNDSSVVDTFRFVNGLIQNTKYYWRVASKGTTVSRSWSGTWSFSTYSPGTLVTITVTTEPAGRSLRVDSVPYISPQTFQWETGSNHTLDVENPQSGGTGIRYVWSHWSDGQPENHVIAVPGINSTYTAHFGTQFFLTMSAGAGGTVDPPSGWRSSGEQVQISASGSGGYRFNGWTGIGSGSYTGMNNPVTITMNGPVTETAAFGNLPSITVTTSPVGRSFVVDGTTYSSAQTFSTWQIGSSHTIGAVSPQSGGTGVQYLWSSWSDDQAQTHTITVPGSNTTYTANFGTQYYLTMVAGTGGTVSPSSGWRGSDEQVQISAIPSGSYSFNGWTGSGSGSYTGLTNPATVVLRSPTTETAAFTVAPPSPPTATGAGAITTSGFTAHWVGVSGAQRYLLEVATDAGVTSPVPGYNKKDVGNATSHGVAGLSPNTPYYYRVRAVNDGGESSPSAAMGVKTYAVDYTFSQAVTFAGHGKLTEYNSGDYQLVGMPGNSGKDIGTFLPGTWKEDWQVYWDNGKANGYYVEYQNGSGDFTASVGKAFWVLYKGPLTMNGTVSTASLDTGDAVGITLTPGQKWNLITNPFDSKISWTAVAGYNGIPNATIQVWQSGFKTVTEMQPYVGYMFANDWGKTILRVPYRLTMPGATGKVEASRDGWRVDVVVRCGKYQDETSWFGVKEGAQQGWDEYEQHKPRHFTIVPDVYFDRPEWDAVYQEFATDIRPGVEDVEVWEMQVRSEEMKGVEVEFRGLAVVPGDVAVYLVDGQGRRYQDLRKEAIYVLQPGSKVTPVKILVGEPEQVRRQAEEVVPKAFALDQNYPNPFNPRTTIAVTMADQGELVLEVWSVLGQRVRRLHEGVLQAGRYYFTWDGAGDDGRGVSSGIYFVRATGPHHQHLLRAMCLVR